MRTLIAALLLTTAATAASPSLSVIQPRGVQRGVDSVITVNGNNLADAQEVVFYAPGFTVTKIEPVNNGQFKAHLRLAGDTRLGEHAVRIRTATGITEMKTMYVGALPVVDEKEPNNDFAAPQKVGLNVTVHGVADNEDADYYAVEAKKGQRISAEVEGMRLSTTFFDPYIAILDAKRFEMATSDDSALYKQDGCLSVVAPEDGTYYVQVRETSYAGNGGCQYRVHIGTFPRPLAVLPAGGKLGEEVEVRFLGDATGEIRQKFKLPAVMPEDGRFFLHCQDAGGICPGGIPFSLSATDVNVIEVEPNDAAAQATAGVLPCAFNGVIEKPSDVDHFKFKAVKGQVFDVHCLGRRAGSLLDPVMAMGLMGAGAMVANDDAIGPDSFFRVTIPQDGEYWVSVTDHLKKGGPTYAYRVELRPVEAVARFSVPSFAQFSQERQAYAVARGNRYATLVNIGRQDFGGDLTVTATGLPAKTTFATDLGAGNVSVVPMVFEAALDAPLSTGRIKYTGVHADPKVAIKSATDQRAELIIGQGQAVFCSRTEAEALLAVTEAAPFKINIVEPKVPLVHGGTMNLKVVAERAAGFKGAITLIPLYNPPGMGAASSIVIPEGQTEGLIPMNANGGTPVRKWKYAVMGQAVVGNGPVWVSSQLATIEIAPAYMGFAMERAAVEQGKDTQMFIKIANVKPFAGEAVVRLVGMPPKTAFPAELKITKDTKEIAFPVKVDPAAPAGIHKNIFCQVVVTENGEQVAHNLGGTELRIDVPLPPKKDAPVVVKPATPAPMPVAPPTAAPPKRLTRLEQLRLEQEEREKAAKAGTPAPVAPPKK